MMTEPLLPTVAASDGDGARVEEQLGVGQSHSPAVLAMWGLLRHHFGMEGSEELVLRGRDALPRDDVGSRYIVEVALHRVLGEPLRDPVPPNWLARSLLAFGR